LRNFYCTKTNYITGAVPCPTTGAISQRIYFDKIDCLNEKSAENYAKSSGKIFVKLFFSKIVDGIFTALPPVGKTL